MSESTATVIKILSSLTSPKASVKYISVGVFMLLAWKYISGAVESYAIPSEQKSLIVLFIGLGLGSLIGHFIYIAFDFFWSKYKSSKEEAAKKLAVQLAEKESLRTKELSDIKLLDEFKKVYSHYDYSIKKLLRTLSAKDYCLDWGTNDVDIPKDNGYIQKILNIDRERDIYKLHPALVDYVSNEWSAEVNNNMSEFFDNFNEDKQSLIKLLEFENGDNSEPIDSNVIYAARYNQGVFNIELEDDTGFYISVVQPYHDLICEKLNVELSDEIYILKARIGIEENVE